MVRLAGINPMSHPHCEHQLHSRHFMSLVWARLLVLGLRALTA
jgi:hypothetical protein